MNLQDTKKELAQAIVASKKAKTVIEFAAKEGRQLIDESDIHELQEMALMLSADVAVIESNLSRYGRMGMTRKFVTIK